MKSSKITVTKPFLPPKEEYIKYIDKIWDNEWVTNNGPLVKVFKEKLKKYLNTKNILLTTNGHLALDTCIKALDLPEGGEVITTPFTFASTTHAITLNNLVPVFCDIKEDTLTIDENKIEELITKKTVAILAVHVYGHPCNTTKIEKIAKKHNLKVIYDAAHSFGISKNSKSILNCGDASICSFHATKVFNTIEGGCAVFKDPKLDRIFNAYINFGIEGQEKIEFIGGNAKMSELQASIGLINLKEFNKVLEKRKELTLYYRKKLDKIPGIKYFIPEEISDYNYNYSYMPIIIDKKKFGKTRDEIYNYLKDNNILTRKYFYPLTPDFGCYKKIYNTSNLPIAKEISKKILCLPLYHSLSFKDIDLICDKIKSLYKYSNIYRDKKLLVLGGTAQQSKFVETAKEMNIYTVVTDYLVDSPAKKIANKSYMTNITDIKGLEELCKKEKIDGILSGYIDPCQKPYNDICEKLNMFCYGTKEQFLKMTDKKEFKQMCMDNDIDTITEYDIEDIDNGKIKYPVLVKPTDSRGSRGQSVCYNKNELLKAIEVAKDESSNNEFIIEQYMKNKQEFQATYFFKDGEPYLLRTADSYTGSEENKLEKVVICAISPSKYTDLYIKTAHKKVINMFKKMGIKNGPVFMQGFIDNDKFKFFDPGLRFPGVDYERIYKKVYGVDIIKDMIDIAFTGKTNKNKLPKDGYYLKNKKAAVLFPTLKKGTIKDIKGINKIKMDDSIISYIPRCDIGEKIDWSYDINQRFCEIDVLANTIEELKEKIRFINNELTVLDENSNNMIYETIDENIII